jgi:hypothetical protein
MTAGPRAHVARFRVDWDGAGEGSGFLRVEFAPLLQDAPGGEIVLTRAIDGDPALYQWFDSGRGAQRPRTRTLQVALLDASGGTVAALAIGGARPVRYWLSSLDALGDGPVLESLALAFATMAWKA